MMLVTIRDVSRDWHVFAGSYAIVDSCPFRHVHVID